LKQILRLKNLFSNNLHQIFSAPYRELFFS
jgi:hypothetical protein